MVRNNKRGQAAMEFLMTYGWAILVVLAAIGALAYFGVLSPDNFLPSKCTISPQFACTEWKVTDVGAGGTDTIQLGIQNNLGSTADINVTITSDDCGTPTAEDADGTDTVYVNTSIQNGRMMGENNLIAFTCANDLSEGDKFQADIELTYVLGTSSLDHTVTGSLQTKVE